ncbi:hypothetical protein MBLNU459_g7759t1 [Dothideomycetes sp. NU459]
MKLSLGSHNHALPFSHAHDHKHKSLRSPLVANRTLTDTPSLVLRSAESSSTCGSSNSGTCQKPTDASGSGNLTIALAAAIPTVAALVVLFFLHRRIRRKQRLEDANDKHKSLDFGLDVVPGGKKGRSDMKVPEMTVTDMEKSTSNIMRGRGLSMDMSSPYLLPAALQTSRESFHSMSRTLPDSEDPYRPVTFRNDNDSVYSAATRGMRKDNASVYTGSSDRSGDNARLLNNASRISQSNPFSNENATSPDSYTSRESNRPQPPPSAHRGSSPNKPLPNPNRRSLAMAPGAFNPRQPSQQPAYASAPVPRIHEPQPSMSEYGGNDFDSQNQTFQVTPPSPPAHEQTAPVAHRYSITEAPRLEEPAQSTIADRRVSGMGLRPLPPDDPTDNPEQRANRIRSFYKEYFDDSKPNPPGHYPQYSPYEEVYDQDYYEDGAVYDPETGAFISARAPFAQPAGRRAMTPDARGPNLPYGRVRSNSSFQSTGHINNPAFQKGPRAPMQPKKKLPPPIALTSLPTPHKLKDDMAFSPISFAPKATYRDHRLGRGMDSPTGTSRPYSPAVPAHNPLVRSFDDLMVMPSPHELRKSGAFTGLDFAPPPRFRNEGSNASDAGSIRSNRSGISQVQRDAVRAGAYRVSRIPKEMVGTHADVAAQLKPTWDMRK